MDQAFFLSFELLVFFKPSISNTSLLASKTRCFQGVAASVDRTRRVATSTVMGGAFWHRVAQIGVAVLVELSFR